MNYLATPSLPVAIPQQRTPHMDATQEYPLETTTAIIMPNTRSFGYDSNCQYGAANLVELKKEDNRPTTATPPNPPRNQSRWVWFKTYIARLGIRFHQTTT